MKNTLIKISLLTIISGLIITNTSSVFAEDNIGIVKGSYINLRSEPKFNSKIVAKKLRGDVYTIQFEKDNWLKVLFKDNTEGWIYRTLIEDSKRNKASININNASDSININNDDEINKQKNLNNNDSEVKESNKEVKKSSVDNTKKQIEKKEEKPLIKEVKKDKVSEIVEISGTAEDLYNDAIKLYEQRKYYEALEKNKLANQKAPKNAEILNNLGNCQFKLGRFEEALNSWKEALKIAPRSGKICNNLGIAYYQLDKNKDAIEYYKKAIIFEPDFSDPYYNIASVYGFIGNFEEAIQNYKKFLEFNPDDTMKKLAEERINYCEKQLNKK